MGGRSSSSNQTTTTTTNTTNTTNTSGSAAVSGDNNGVMLAGVSDSHINVTMTDHGAMERASQLGELALASNTDVATAAINANADVSETAMESVSQAHGENLQMLAGLAGNQAAQNTQNIEALKELAEMKIDGGQVATSKQMTITVGIVIAFLAVFMLMKGKG
ncbi:chemotaxis protein [Photobacterium aphoticum]|uniref:Chemotaxis protein n=2 Tax=Photobacterium aphoticum TaxID=754436 RepID=A0A0J1JJ05_9GAMM|nr:hypothetical protein [Photobacterium aphoticum]KLV01997.1 chemotaxis protein [Photobacterium aphoticum]PSU60243.1 chemotaxis protein [Photobacterium aphoticum]GHA34317.1 hypothetical protein GCM10007086_04700 [Photobacterium aphoticum]